MVDTGADQSRPDRIVASPPQPAPPNKKMKIALFSAKSYDINSFEKHLKQDFPEDKRPQITYITDGLNLCTAEKAAGHDAICLFVNDKCSADIVTKLHELGVKLILCRCAGFDNVDIPTATAKNMPVLRVPIYSPFAVAEFAWSLLMCLNRKVHTGYARNRDGYFNIDGLQGMDLHGKTAGVLGTGNIGRIFINIALGFGMKVKCYDVYEYEPLKSVPNVSYAPLDEVLKEADILSLHAPLMPTTYHMIDEAKLKLVKPHLLIVNTSRGGLVDAAAVVKAVHEKRLGGYGSDVYEGESNYFFSDHSNQPITDPILNQLINTRNIILTAHQAFLTGEALEKICTTTIQNSIDYLLDGKKGDELVNRVVPPK